MIKWPWPDKEKNNSKSQRNITVHRNVWIKDEYTRDFAIALGIYSYGIVNRIVIREVQELDPTKELSLPRSYKIKFDMVVGTRPSFPLIENTVNQLGKSITIVAKADSASLISLKEAVERALDNRREETTSWNEKIVIDE